MYKVNMMPPGYNPNWWAQQQAKKKEKKEWTPPDKCTFCGRKIEDGAYFNAGYDEHKIYAETCDHIRCKQWLKWKVRRKK